MLWVGWSEEEADRRIAEISAYFAARNRRFVWLVGPSSRPPDLARRLAKHGFRKDVEENERILVARLPVQRLRVNDEVRIVEVADDESLRDSVSVMGTRWHDAVLMDRRRYLACKERRGGFLVAYFEGNAAGTAGWTFTADGRAVLLNGGVVREEFRRRGVYSSMVGWRVERALERACLFAALVANPRTSGPILSKRNFADLGPMPIFYSP